MSTAGRRRRSPKSPPGFSSREQPARKTLHASRWSATHRVADNATAASRRESPWSRPQVGKPVTGRRRSRSTFPSSCPIRVRFDSPFPPRCPSWSATNKEINLASTAAGEAPPAALNLGLSPRWVVSPDAISQVLPPVSVSTAAASGRLAPCRCAEAPLLHPEAAVRLASLSVIAGSAPRSACRPFSSWRDPTRRWISRLAMRRSTVVRKWPMARDGTLSSIGRAFQTYGARNPFLFPWPPGTDRPAVRHEALKIR